jgi:hypothetical protein
MRIASLLWETPKVILGEVLEVRNVDCCLQVARKERHSDDWDPPVQVYGRYWPGDEFVDD